jgi:mycothiol system anti-sigma-R factor
MPDCNKTLRELQLYLDGELPAGERDHVLDHLNECLECYHAFDFQAELKQVIAKKCRTEEMPAGLMERIRQCFEPDAGAGTSRELNEPV